MSQEQTVSMAEGFSLVPTHLIDDPSRPLRSDITEESVADLILSIKQMGIIEPIILRPKGGRFEVIAGHRRLFASQLAKLEKVPCIVKNISLEETEIMKLHENIYREDIRPSDEAKHFDYLIQQLKISPAKVASLVGKSPSYVSDRLAIFNYPPELRQALDEKKIAFSTARAFARHPDKNKVRQFVRYAVQNGCTPTMAQQWVNDDIRATEHSNQESAPSAGGNSYQEAETPSYHCILCKDPIAVTQLTVAYLHDQCSNDLQKELQSAPSSSVDPDPQPIPTANGEDFAAPTPTSDI